MTVAQQSDIKLDVVEATMNKFEITDSNISNDNKNSTEDAIKLSNLPVSQDLKDSSSSELKKKITGVFLALIGAFLIVTSQSIVKLSTQPVHTLAVIRGFIMVCVSFAIGLYANASFFGEKKEDRKWIAVRCIMPIGFLCSWFCVKFIPVTIALVIINSNPIYGMILARVFLKEIFGVYECSVLVFAFTGVIVVVNPTKIIEDLQGNTNVQDHIIGCALAFTTAVLFAILALTSRKLKHLHFSVLIFWAGLFTFLLSLVLVIIFDSLPLPTSTYEIMLDVFAAVADIAGVMLYTCSFKFISVGPVMVIISTEVIFAAIYQVILFNDPISFTTGVGSCLICFTIVLLNTKSWVKGIATKLCEMFSSK